MKIRIPVDSVGMRVLDILLVGSKANVFWQLRYPSRRNTAVSLQLLTPSFDRVGGVQDFLSQARLHCAVTAGRSQMNTCNTFNNHSDTLFMATILDPSFEEEAPPNNQS